MEPMFLVIGESVAGGRRIYRFGPVNRAASFTRACAGDEAPFAIGIYYTQGEIDERCPAEHDAASS